jgi:DNA-binding MarR family transcriptional regulator/ribosomal protein S18 acetylase RimI-like enzyme
MPGAPSVARLDAVRAFNRFYTRRIGVLGEHLLDSPYSLAETRVLYELAHRRAPTATDLGRDLGLDAGYLSRILRRFDARGLIRRAPSRADRRQSLLQLTRKGRSAFAPLEARARREVAAMLTRLPDEGQRQVVDAMDALGRLLGDPQPDGAPFVLRAHRAGDMGWVVQRHGAIYAREWGYNHEFEALVARICADFLENFDPSGERCWIAERHGRPVGSVVIVRKSKTVAKLRLLLVEPDARGLGIGKRLVDEAVAFARAAGYKRLTLWTQSDLDAARRLYQQAGFRRVHQERHDSFGKKGLVAETWDLTLSALRS